MSISNSSIETSEELQKLFLDQVNKDNLEFKISSIYLPNPIYTLSPKHCLVAMEPSLAGQTPEIFQSWINQGFKNFLYSNGDFILHYCAYTFLCKESFDYHITDISKGAMNTAIANHQRKNRYANWLMILKQELEFFGQPQVIGIGQAANEFLTDANFHVKFSIMHYSQNNCARFNNFYKQYSKPFPINDIHIKFKEFAAELLKRANYRPYMQDHILNKIFKKELSDWEKGMFLNYMDQFSATSG